MRTCVASPVRAQPKCRCGQGTLTADGGKHSIVPNPLQQSPPPSQPGIRQDLGAKSRASLSSSSPALARWPHLSQSAPFLPRLLLRHLAGKKEGRDRKARVWRPKLRCRRGRLHLSCPPQFRGQTVRRAHSRGRSAGSAGVKEHSFPTRKPAALRRVRPSRSIQRRAWAPSGGSVGGRHPARIGALGGRCGGAQPLAILAPRPPLPQAPCSPSPPSEHPSLSPSREAALETRPSGTKNPATHALPGPESPVHGRSEIRATCFSPPELPLLSLSETDVPLEKVLHCIFQIIPCRTWLASSSPAAQESWP